MMRKARLPLEVSVYPFTHKHWHMWMLCVGFYVCMYVCMYTPGEASQYRSGGLGISLYANARARACAYEHVGVCMCISMCTYEKVYSISVCLCTAFEFSAGFHARLFQRIFGVVAQERRLHAYRPSYEEGWQVWGRGWFRFGDRKYLWGRRWAWE